MKLKTVLLALAIAGFQFSDAQPVKKHGQLKVVGTQLSNEKGEPVVLRGMSFGWHNFWPRFYNQKAVSWLYKDWECSVVRAAMGIEPRGGYKQDSAGSVDKVRAVVDGAIKSGIYVIIDWHSHNINLEEAKEFFSLMASLYGNYPNVIYEIFNEPDEESWQDVKAYSIDVITAIRKHDPDNVILVGSPHWSQDLHLAAASPITGFDHLMYTVHFYAATHKEWLRKRCDEAMKNGLPIFISESAGMEASGNGPIDEAEWTRWIEWAERNRLSWITWSVSDKNETCSVLIPSARSEGKWRKRDLKESGRKARALIRKYNRR